MKRLLLLGVVTAILFCSASGCKSAKSKAISWEDMTPEERLEVMRSDTSYISYLDSVARAHIGEDARCLDPVQHLFECGGRYWLFCNDWGGLLEIPQDWIPEEDLVQTELSFHGTNVWSPDSLTLVQMYSGFSSCESEEEYETELREMFAEDSITISSWQKTMVPFTEEWSSPAVTVRGRNMDGINYYGRFIFHDHLGVEHSASVQWDDSAPEDAQTIIGFMVQFPFGPEEQLPEGDAAI